MTVDDDYGLWLGRRIPLAEGENLKMTDAYKIFIICTIAIAYSMGQTIKLVCVSAFVCLSVRLCSALSNLLRAKVKLIFLTSAERKWLVNGKYLVSPSLTR